MDGSQRGDLTAGAGRYSGRAIQRDRLALAGGRLCPVVAWVETRPALECASERARLGKHEREGDVGDRAARVFDVRQGEVLWRLCAENEARRRGLSVRVVRIGRELVMFMLRY